MRTSPPITITDEIPGNEYADLETARRAALPAVSDNLASVIRDLLEREVLVIRDGKLIPNPDKKACRSHSTSTGTPQDAKAM